jgi:hypothetical protein
MPSGSFGCQDMLDAEIRFLEGGCGRRAGQDAARIGR